MTFSYNWLQSFFAKKLPLPAKLAEVLTLHFAEVEEVKKVKGDFVLGIDVRPNRAADCFSHLGVAREIAALLNYELRIPDAKFVEDKSSRAKDLISVEVKEKKACPRYTAKAVTNVKVGPSPQWLKERLEVCGLNSINNIVDVANYVMLETGQPLHAFDAQKLTGRKIVVRFAKEREKIVTLDEQRFDLNPSILVIADAQKAVAIAGIKGGKMPEIDKKTKVVILESANFDYGVIRRGSKQLSLKTDASVRFEHGLDPNLTESAISRAAFLIQKVAGGRVAQGLIDVYPNRVFPKRIKLDLNYVARLLGVEIPQLKIKNILRNLGFKLSGVGSQSLAVEVPTRRLDVSLPEDLVEEVGRIYGYEKIPAILPVVSLASVKKNEEAFWQDAVKNILRGTGFTEVYNYSFVGENEAKNFNHGGGLIELTNPLNQDQKYLRPSLITGLLKNAQSNQAFFDQIKIFELGKVFNFRRVQGKSEEKRMLTGLMTGDSFYQMKGAVDVILNGLGISNVWYDDYRATPEDSQKTLWQPQRCAEIKTDHQEIGFLGEISPRVLQSFKVSGRIVIFDIDFEKLQKLASEEQEYVPLSKFPSAVRDLAILVPKQTKVDDVLSTIDEVGGDLVRDVDLFDIYEGEELPDDKKNLAFHVIYQSAQRTLSSKEVDEVHQKIIKALEKNPGWQVRK